MERLALIGVSHRRGGAEALERWQVCLPAEALPRAGFGEAVLLATCNRWDAVVALPPGVDVHEARARLTPDGTQVRPYAYVGDGALEQLIRIAASLDSLNPGEDQIMRQVREAFAVARQAGRTGPTLSFAFHSALRAAKRVRREVALAPMNTSLFSLAKPAIERALPRGGRLAILGAGEMGTLAAKALGKTPGLTVWLVNRTPARAQQLAASLGVTPLGLDAFLRAPPQVEVLVCTTPVRHLVDAALLSRLGKLKLVVDLGIPRNVDAEAAAARGVQVLDVDSLQQAGAARREAIAEQLAKAEEIVREELERALQEWTERQLGPSIQRLRQLYLDTIGELLPAEEAAKLAHKFAHVPIKGLRALAREHGFEAARTFLLEAGLGEKEA